MAKSSGLGVIGGAGLGLVLAHLAACQGHQVRHFVPDAERREELRQTRRLASIVPSLEAAHPSVIWVDELKDLARASQLVILTGAPEPIENTVTQMGEVLDGSHLVIHAIHRLRDPGLETTAQLIRESTCCLQLGALAGCLSLDEMLSGQAGAIVVGSPFPQVIEQARHFLTGPALSVFGDRDLPGVEYAAALVQIVEVVVGMAEALQLGMAAQSMLMVGGLTEVGRLGQFLGASRDVFAGLAGLAKLLVGVRRGSGANFELGHLIACKVTGEDLQRRAPPYARALSLIPQVCRFALDHDLSLPMIEGLDEVCKGHASPDDFMRRMATAG